MVLLSRYARIGLKKSIALYLLAQFFKFQKDIAIGIINRYDATVDLSLKPKNPRMHKKKQTMATLHLLAFLHNTTQSKVFFTL